MEPAESALRRRSLRLGPAAFCNQPADRSCISAWRRSRWSFIFSRSARCGQAFGNRRRFNPYSAHHFLKHNKLAIRTDSFARCGMNFSKANLHQLLIKRPNILLRLLGPGLVTGAADDDPSGIAT